MGSIILANLGSNPPPPPNVLSPHGQWRGVPRTPTHPPPPTPCMCWSLYLAPHTIGVSHSP